MTTLLAQALLANGHVPLSQFSGNPADASTQVLLVGRDADSGTRVVSFAEPAFGVFSLPVQFQVDLTGTTVTNVEFYPTQTINGTFYDLGQGGYSGGGNVKTTLNGTGSASAPTPYGTGCWLVGYLGINDANGVNGGANNLTYNGVAYGATIAAGHDAVVSGQYTFWSYEHLMYRNSLTGNFKTVADAIAAQITTTDAAQSGILLGDMGTTSRTVEGGVVTH